MSARKLSERLAERIAELLIRNRRLMQGDGVAVIASELAPLDAVVEAAQREVKWHRSTCTCSFCDALQQLSAHLEKTP